MKYLIVAVVIVATEFGVLYAIFQTLSGITAAELAPLWAGVIALSVFAYVLYSFVLVDQEASL